jgi:hypothetical protein
MTAAVSRKSHPAFGNCDVPVFLGVPIGGAIAIEPRVGPSHTLLLTFNSTVNSVGGITVQDASLNNVGSAILAPLPGSIVTVTLNGIPENKRVTVTLTGLNGSATASLALGFLIGDISGSGSVNAVDISAVKALSNATLTANNCRADLNLNGSIGATDVSIAKVRSGIVLP